MVRGLVMVGSEVSGPNQINSLKTFSKVNIYLSERPKRSVHQVIK